MKEQHQPLDLIHGKLEAWWTYAVRMLPNFFLALVVFVLFLVVARIVRRITRKIILRLSDSASVSSLVSGVLYTAVVIGGIMSALDILQLDKTVSSLLAGVGIIGLALGFAFQDLTANFISGAYIAFKRPFDVGHIIETNGFQGTIEEIELRSTTLRTSAGLHVIIPNKEIFQKPIINYSRTDQRRVEVEFSLSNSIDASFAQRIIEAEINQLPAEFAVHDFAFYYTSIEAPNMRIHISFWTPRITPQEFMKVKHETILAIFKTFARYGIYSVTPAPDQSNNTQNG